MDLHRGGAQAIEIFGARQHMDYANRKQHVREIADWFKSSGIPLHSVHSPLYADYEWGRAGAPPMNIASIDRAGRIEAMDEIKRALEIAEHIPFRFLIQHIGLPNEIFNEHKFDAAMTSVEHLRAFAKPLGVRILLENIPNELSTPDTLVEFIRTSHMEDVGVCFDIGHANMMGDVAQAFRDPETAYLLDAHPRQRERQRLAPVAGKRLYRLERSHGTAASGAAKSATVAGDRREEKVPWKRLSRRSTNWTLHKKLEPPRPQRRRERLRIVFSAALAYSAVKDFDYVLTHHHHRRNRQARRPICHHPRLALQPARKRQAAVSHFPRWFRE